MDTSWSNSESLAFVEGLYSQFLTDPASVAPEWRRYFEGLPGNGFAGRTATGPSFARWSLFDPPASNGNGNGNGNGVGPLKGGAREVAERQDKVDQLVRSYRVRGHAVARIDPLERPREPQPELELGFYGLTEADLARPVSTHAVFGMEQATLGTLIERLRNTYCRSIGVQFMHIGDLKVKRWLQERMERSENRITLARAEQLRILTKLTDAVIFEEFIQKKYLGAKSFSLEGSESLVPLLDIAVDYAGEQGAQEIVFGMAHRGRLNVLANILGKRPSQIFREFEDADPELLRGRGDVKYHKGFSSDVTTSGGRRVHLSLCFNPSHLEFVDPVAVGRMRAKQDRHGDRERSRGFAILIHGDAAFIGEGVVQETLNMSQLAAYSTGGTIHVVVNNQIGFTTNPRDARSSEYCTDVAKMLQSPIFHVNGEDPEAVAMVVRMALDFRATFKRDVVIDMYGYRRRGHNEGDEPSFTDPLLYQAIARRKSVREGYLEHLLALGEVTRKEADEITERRRAALESELSAARASDFELLAKVPQGASWTRYVGGPDAKAPDVETGVERARLVDALRKLAETPPGFHLHPKLERFVEARREMAEGKRELDWAAAEALALATLSLAGARVRLTGQDSERGTFSSRHAVLHDTADGRAWCPLQHLAPGQGEVEIANSPLAETGVLGFEYGYSLDCPEGLVLWEAQFGDFVNAAQVIIDQFLVSAEDKWNRLSGLTLLLPHGFEGQGPEHSSARLERFLTLSAEDNIQVVAPTTPAQYFHVLRRQVVRPWRKPLVVMTPKSLLRHPRVVSPLADFERGSFRRFLPDPRKLDAARVRRVLLTSGKLYYELADEREKLGLDDVAIVRMEQYYPLADADVAAALAPYPAQAPVVWIQEEPENMGAWRSLRVRFLERIGAHPFSGIARPASASPATGSGSSHKLEQAELIARAFARD